MGEAKRRNPHGGGYTGAAAALEFFKRALNAADGVDIVFRDAELSNGKIVVACQIDGFSAALSTSELRLLAEVAEETIRKFPSAPEVLWLSDLVLSLRESADRVDGIYGSRAGATPLATRDEGMGGDDGG